MISYMWTTWSWQLSETIENIQQTLQKINGKRHLKLRELTLNLERQKCQKEDADVLREAL